LPIGGAGERRCGSCAAVFASSSSSFDSSDGGSSRGASRRRRTWRRCRTERRTRRHRRGARQDAAARGRILYCPEPERRRRATTEAAKTTTTRTSTAMTLVKAGSVLGRKRSLPGGLLRASGSCPPPSDRLLSLDRRLSLGPRLALAPWTSDGLVSVAGGLGGTPRGRGRGRGPGSIEDASNSKHESVRRSPSANSEEEPPQGENGGLCPRRKGRKEEDEQRQQHSVGAQERENGGRRAATAALCGSVCCDSERFSFEAKKAPAASNPTSSRNGHAPRSRENRVRMGEHARRFSAAHQQPHAAIFPCSDNHHD
jgi:hypothetical protein